MFGKKRRPASGPPQRVPANPSTPASLAATTAFARDRETTVGLSNAAAAQALRAHVTTPTPVGDTVTKRMIRRSSLSSNGSSARPPSAGLRRQSSSGSMTERSFRAASPARASPAEPAAPPVPPVPQNIPESSVVHRRASSLEPTFRGDSPARSPARGRGASVDSHPQNMSVKGHAPTSFLPNLAEEDSAQTSVNFSRPMSPGLARSKHSASPTGTGWYGGSVVNDDAVRTTSPRPRSSAGLSAFEVHRTQQSIQNAADQPVKKHQISYAVQGTRLANGGMRAKPSGTALQSRSFLAPGARQPPRIVDPNSPNAVYDPSSRTFIHKQDAMTLHRELHEELEQPEQPAKHYVAQHSDNYRPRQRPAQRSPAPARQSMPYETSPASRNRGTVSPQPDTSIRDYTSHALEPEVGLASEQPNYKNTPEVGPESRNVENVSEVPAASQKIASAKDNSHTSVPDPAIPTPINTAVTQSHDRVGTVHDSQSTLSPPRSAHFASVAVELTGEKHTPPPRSSSPAKSALKPSPAVAKRGSSPVAPAGRFLNKDAQSEVSDTISDDGMKKRRSMRVSFEETPVIAGTSAYADNAKPTSPAGLGASKWSPTTEKENEFEDLMKPRAALPVFGSIRNKERRSPPEDVAEKVTETVSSTPMTASASSITEPLRSSNDHALGSIVAQDFARKQEFHHGASRLEESGYVSDSSRESDSHKQSDGQASLKPSLVPEPKSLTTPTDEKSSTPASMVERIAEVPNIALLPPTPGSDQTTEPQYDRIAIPGGWGEETPSQEVQTLEFPSQKTENAPPTAPVPASEQSPPTDEDDSSDDNSSVYSDAYEDLTDTEGGFGSIDAMVESPVVPMSSGLMSSKHADKSAAVTTPSKLRDQTTIENDAGPVAFLAQSQEVSTRTVQAPIVRQVPKEERRSANEAATQSSPKPLKSAMKKTGPAQPVRAAEPQMRRTMRGEQGPVPRAQGSMRSTMRGSSDNVSQAQPQMRRSMRGTDSSPPIGVTTSQPQMRKSMRESDPPSPVSPGLAASRHSMIQMDTKQARGALQKRNIPTGSPTPKPRPQSVAAAKPVVIPAPTYDSDSDGSASSFQRTRASARRKQGGQYTMRGSMRNNAAPTMRSNAAAPTPTQVRAISPPVSPAPAMRKSMRPSSPTPEQPKSSKFRLRSLSPVGRFRSSKSPERDPPSPMPSKKMTMPTFGKQPKQKASKAGTQRRFADSSDEDEDETPRHFQSRFADSDSDDGEIYRLPPDLAPVRGIPKRAGEEDGDSTDLEEEEVDYEKANKSAGPSTNGTVKGQPNGITNGKVAALSGSLRDSKHAPTLPTFEAGEKAKSKRGFFGLGKKKTGPSPQPEPAPPTPAAEPEASPPPSQSGRQLGLPLTPIEEDKDFGTTVSDSPEAKEVKEVKKAPKLHRRSTPEWPLPSTAKVGDDDRPMSSDGLPPRRPRFQMRQSSTTSNVTAPAGETPGRTVSFGRDGKKKKFQGLRRVLRLND